MCYATFFFLFVVQGVSFFPGGKQAAIRATLSKQKVGQKIQWWLAAEIVCMWGTIFIFYFLIHIDTVQSYFSKPQHMELEGFVCFCEWFLVGRGGEQGASALFSSSVSSRWLPYWLFLTWVMSCEDACSSPVLAVGVPAAETLPLFVFLCVCVLKQ